MRTDLIAIFSKCLYQFACAHVHKSMLSFSSTFFVCILMVHLFLLVEQVKFRKPNCDVCWWHFGRKSFQQTMMTADGGAISRGVPFPSKSTHSPHRGGVYRGNWIPCSPQSNVSAFVIDLTASTRNLTEHFSHLIYKTRKLSLRIASYQPIRQFVIERIPFHVCIVEITMRCCWTQSEAVELICIRMRKHYSSSRRFDWIEKCPARV